MAHWFSRIIVWSKVKSLFSHFYRCFWTSKKRVFFQKTFSHNSVSRHNLSFWVIWTPLWKEKLFQGKILRIADLKKNHFTNDFLKVIYQRQLLSFIRLQVALQCRLRTASYLWVRLWRTLASLRHVKVAMSLILSNFGGFICWTASACKRKNMIVTKRTR